MQRISIPGVADEDILAGEPIEGRIDLKGVMHVGKRQWGNDIPALHKALLRAQDDAKRLGDGFIQITRGPDSTLIYTSLDPTTVAIRVGE